MERNLRRHPSIISQSLFAVETRKGIKRDLLVTEDSKITDKISNSDAIASCFAAVSWSDSFLGCSERFATFFGFLKAIDRLMEVENQMGTIRNNQTVLPVHQAFRFILGELLEQSREVNDDTVAYKRNSIKYLMRKDCWRVALSRRDKLVPWRSIVCSSLRTKQNPKELPRLVSFVRLTFSSFNSRWNRRGPTVLIYERFYAIKLLLLSVERNDSQRNPILPSRLLWFVMNMNESHSPQSQVVYELRRICRQNISSSVLMSTDAYVFRELHSRTMSWTKWDIIYF